MILNVDTNFTYTLVSSNDLLCQGERLIPEIKRIASFVTDINYYYDDPASFVSLVFDSLLIKQIMELVHRKKQYSPTILVVIGIGGSSLGTQAIFQAILGSMYNQTAPQLRVFFVETVDAVYTSDIIQVVSKELQKKCVVLVNVISKSGTTLETIVNFEVFLALIKDYHPEDYQDYFIITTDKDSLLWKMAQEIGVDCLAIPKKVGGRYSVFSPVGLFPLAMLGISIDELQAGAQAITRMCVAPTVFDNPAAMRAITLYTQYQQGKAIHDLFLFGTDLSGLGAWYRQLMAESIGKEQTVTGEKLFIGITPTVSIGSMDLHSMAQLYLGGPFDKITTFVSVENYRLDLSLSKNDLFKAMHMQYLQSYTFSRIMHAIVSGTKTAFIKVHRPFMSVALVDMSAYSIGQCMQMFMIEMVYLGYLLGVNPFDQPHVELYKHEVHRLLHGFHK